MKTAIFIVALVLVFAQITLADPFLVKDPVAFNSPQPTYFIISLNGGADEQSIPEQTPSGMKLRYDLVNLLEGDNLLKVAECFPGWCTEPASISIEKRRMKFLWRYTLDLNPIIAAGDLVRVGYTFRLDKNPRNTTMSSVLNLTLTCRDAIWIDLGKVSFFRLE